MPPLARKGKITVAQYIAILDSLQDDDFDVEQHLYRQNEKYAFACEAKFDSIREYMSLDHVDPGSTSSLVKGTIAGRELTFINKTWNVASSFREFYTELYFYSHPDLLRPLQGKAVPHVISAYESRPGFRCLALELPHSTEWWKAHPSMTDDQKRAIVRAYQRLHARGILHGNVALRNMLIDKDNNVSIIGFGDACWTQAPPDHHIRKCYKDILSYELRTVQYLINFRDAKTRERQYHHKVSSLNGRRSLWKRLGKPPLDPDDMHRWDHEGEDEEETAHFTVPIPARSEPVPVSSGNNEPEELEEFPEFDELPELNLPPEFDDPSEVDEPEGDHEPETLTGTQDDDASSSSSEGSYSSSDSSDSDDLDSVQSGSPTPSMSSMIANYYDSDLSDEEDDDSAVDKRRRHSTQYIRHAVRFHPDVDDNGVWSTGRGLKQVRRAPTPFPFDQLEEGSEGVAIFSPQHDVAPVSPQHGGPLVNPQNPPSTSTLPQPPSTSTLSTPPNAAASSSAVVLPSPRPSPPTVFLHETAMPGLLEVKPDSWGALQQYMLEKKIEAVVRARTAPRPGVLSRINSLVSSVSGVIGGKSQSQKRKREDVDDNPIPVKRRVKFQEVPLD